IFMASSSGMARPGEDEEAPEEELERFDDFTIASSWERFISEIEAVCRQWLADGPKNLLEKGAVQEGSSKTFHKVKSELKYFMKSYCMEYYFETDSNAKDSVWSDALHELQLSFGVKEFLVIEPQSASRVILDAPEASKLLSAVAIALSNCSSPWSAFVPVHDPSRKAYIGIQNIGTIFTRRFEADRIGSQVPVKLMHLEGLYELFVSKFAFTNSDLSMHLFKVNFMMKLTYRTLPYRDDDFDQTQVADAEMGGSSHNSESDNHNKVQWDDDCPWSEWYSAEDPIKGYEMIALWSEKMVETSMEMAEMENASPHDAHKWFLLPIFSSNLLDDSKENRVGFASQLCLLVNALEMSFDAQFMEDFVSVEHSATDNSKLSMVVPPPSVLDRVLKDLFHEDFLPTALIRHADLEVPNFSKREHKNSRAIKGAPFESLFAQFCFHALWFGNCNIRAIAFLWIEFVREVRWCWEESQPLPKTPVDGSIDLSTCLINQKLQMLAICIEKKCQMEEDYQDASESSDWASSDIEGGSQAGQDLPHATLSSGRSEQKRNSSLTLEGLNDSPTTLSKYDIKSTNVQMSANRKRCGSAGVVRSMMLLKSCQNMHAPFTQDPPLMTEDMHEERLRAVEAFGNSFSFSAQLEKDILLSDMSAFKAANPDAVFEDFIRWHSPGDWESDENETAVSGSHSTDGSKKNWPPRGRLSQRMSENGNSWRAIWNEAPAIPAAEQKPLLDPNREGEKILHYLETLRPHQLLEQMVCTALRASADTLNQTVYGGLKQMTTKLGQLYLTIASTLKPLQVASSMHGTASSWSSEIIEDLRRLCDVFEHVEKLLTVAASLHRKFLQAPRLSEAFFGDFYDFYLPRMGTRTLAEIINSEFDAKQELRYEERQLASDMFTPPTANQSWRKVLSMGNLLNGHEPAVREIIFSMRDRLSGSHYAANTPKNFEHEIEIETYRMYICGTSNDLRVALSVTSCD
ncbi:Rab3GAP catalytic subunit, conserved domain, partial [Dillenia turbinata]